jgi:hypothetical protein
MRKLCIAVMAFAATFSANAAPAAKSQDIMILFNGVTEVNRHAINFVYQIFMNNNIAYNIKYTQNPGDIKPGEFRAVVVLSTLSGGAVDPKLAKFIAAYSSKKEIVLVTLVPGQKTLAVKITPPDKNPQGVDAVSAATLWGERGFISQGGPAPLTKADSGSTISTYNSSIEMHVAWVQHMLDIIDKH